VQITRVLEGGRLRRISFFGGKGLLFSRRVLAAISSRRKAAVSRRQLAGRRFRQVAAM